MNTLFKSIYIYVLLYVGLSVYFVFTTLGNPLIGTDDANIIFVYARNFAHGNGMVYNIGGEHVEGYSCMLYCFICSIFYLFTNSPEVLILFYNLVITALSTILIVNVLKQLANKYVLPEFNLHLIYCIYLAWLIINPLYFGWTVVSLMDSGTYSFLLIASYSYLIKVLLIDKPNKEQNRIVSLLIFLIIVCRPEGTVWGIVYLFNFFLLSYKEKKYILFSLKKIVLPIATYIITILMLTLFRLSYFGYPMPNTYYTKVSASFGATIKDGIEYFFSFVEMYSPLIFIPILILLIWVILIYLSKKEKTTLYYISFLTLSFVLVGILNPILEGGDHFNGFRFIQNIYPFLILPFILLLFIFNQTKSFRILLINGVVAIGLLFYFNNADWGVFMNSNSSINSIENMRVCILNEFYISKVTRENGNMLNKIFKDEPPVIGYGAAGGIAYTYKGTVYDMMGLNNTKMAHADAIKVGPKAHQSFNKKVFYELAPDILMPAAKPIATPISLSFINDYYCNHNSWDNLIFKNIFNDNEFKQKYSLVSVYNKEQPNYVCYGYYNNVYLQKLLQRNNFIIQRFNN